MPTVDRRVVAAGRRHRRDVQHAVPDMGTQHKGRDRSSWGRLGVVDKAEPPVHRNGRSDEWMAEGAQPSHLGSAGEVDGEQLEGDARPGRDRRERAPRRAGRTSRPPAVARGTRRRCRTHGTPLPTRPVAARRRSEPNGIRNRSAGGLLRVGPWVNRALRRLFGTPSGGAPGWLCVRVEYAYSGQPRRCGSTLVR